MTSIISPVHALERTHPHIVANFFIDEKIGVVLSRISIGNLRESDTLERLRDGEIEFVGASDSGSGFSPIARDAARAA